MCWSWKTSSCHKIQKLIVNFPSNVNLHSTIAKAFTSICLAFFNWMFPLKMLDYLRKCLAPIMSSFSHTQPAHPTHSKTESKEKRFEPLHLTSYQYPNQLKFNIFLFFVPFFVCVAFEHTRRRRCNKTDVCMVNWEIAVAMHMSNISAMALKFFKIVYYEEWMSTTNGIYDTFTCAHTHTHSIHFTFAAFGNEFGWNREKEQIRKEK